MKKRFGGLYPLQAIILGFLILIGILVGTFADLPIEQAIYHSHTNWYSQFIEFFGSLPPAALLGSGAVFFFLYFKDQTNLKNHSLYAYLLLFGVTAFVGAVWGYEAFHRAITINHGTIYSALIGIPVIAATNVLFWLFLRKYDTKTFARKGSLIAVAGVAVLVFTFLCKSIVVRPRYFAIMEEMGGNTDLYFRPWYLFSRNMDGLENVDHYYLESWPSGHSAFGFLTLTSLVFSDIGAKDSKKRSYLYFSLSILWMLMTGFGRMLGGSHYISDVSFGYLFGLIPLALSFFLFYRKKTDLPLVEKKQA
ncbi:MAG: phosphatase PAP2 family protein [Bacilli bacterium]